MRVTPRISCLIATTPRTGSWLLAEGLDDTGIAGEPQEYFGWEGFEDWSREFGLEPSASPLRFVEEAIAYGTTDNGVFSAKLHWSQLERLASRIRTTPGSWPESEAGILLALFPNLHCVHLRREDTARQAISYWRAVQAGTWWDVGLPRRRRVQAGPDFQQIRWCEDLLVLQDGAWRELLAAHRIPTCEVVYETFVQDRVATVERVLDFLGIPHGALDLPASRLRRQADARTEEWLSRYRELRDELPGLPGRWRWVGRGIEPIAP